MGFGCEQCSSYPVTENGFEVEAGQIMKIHVGLAYYFTPSHDVKILP